MTRTLTSAQYSAIFRDQPALYESLLKLGYLLPSFKDKLINSRFLIEVSQDKIWLPKAEKKFFQDCLNPPTSEVLVDQVLKALKSAMRKKSPTEREATQRLVELIQITTPHKGFLIRLLSQLEPNHPIFKLTYVPPPPQARTISYPQPNLQVDSRLVDLGVAAKRKRGARSLKMQVNSQIKEDIDLKNIDAHILKLNSKKQQIQIEKEFKKKLKRKQEEIEREHKKSMATLQAQSNEQILAQVSSFQNPEVDPLAISRSMSEMSLQDKKEHVPTIQQQQILPPNSFNEHDLNQQALIQDGRHNVDMNDSVEEEKQQKPAKNPQNQLVQPQIGQMRTHGQMEASQDSVTNLQQTASIIGVTTNLPVLQGLIAGDKKPTNIHKNTRSGGGKRKKEE